MSRKKIAVGPGASSLILIAVVLALSMLTMLTMLSARSDEALALRSLQTRQEVYGLFAAGEKSLAALDAELAASIVAAMLIIPLVIGRVKKMKWEVSEHERSKIRR